MNTSITSFLGRCQVSRLLRKKGWETVEIDPKKTKAYKNVRPMSEDHVEELAKDIEANGQLQPCLADTLPDGPIRVIAGIHRRDAILKLVKEGKRVKLLVRVWPTELPPGQILTLQISENLHKEMGPVEESKAIQKIYVLFKASRGEEKFTKKEFAQKIGRSEKKVRNALRFSILDTKVRKMAETDQLLFKVAVNIARLPKEEQFKVANRIVMQNISRKKALLMIDRILTENDGQVGMFAGEQAIKLAEQNYVIAIRTAVDRMAKTASGYFERFLRQVDIYMPKEEGIYITDAVKDLLASFISSAFAFLRKLEEIDPDLAREIKERAEGEKKKPQ